MQLILHTHQLSRQVELFTDPSMMVKRKANSFVKKILKLTNYLSHRFWLKMNPVYQLSPSSWFSFQQYHIQYGPLHCTTLKEHPQWCYEDQPVIKKPIKTTPKECTNNKHIHEIHHEHENKQISYAKTFCYKQKSIINTSSSEESLSSTTSRESSLSLCSPWLISSTPSLKPPSVLGFSPSWCYNHIGLLKSLKKTITLLEWKADQCDKKEV